MSGVFWLEHATSNIRTMNRVLQKRLDTPLSAEALEECLVVSASIDLWLDHLESKIEPMADDLLKGQEAIRRAKEYRICVDGEGAR